MLDIRKGMKGGPVWLLATVSKYVGSDGWLGERRLSPGC